MNPIGLGVLLVGLLWIFGFGAIHYRAARKAQASETWPRAPGKLLRAEILVEESSSGEGGTTTWYNPAVAYAYKVADRKLEGKRLRFGNARSTIRKRAEAMLAPYAVGATVSVRYNPEKPEECVLESHAPAATALILAAAGIPILVLGAWLVAVAR
ncbi:MAG TPA: DUF3592 domain-containing protein [Allosphingosinicella sp.]|nr:DUF3592 domain-containing protein [Allosphingosinicella sp.]